MRKIIHRKCYPRAYSILLSIFTLPTKSYSWCSLTKSFLLQRLGKCSFLGVSCIVQAVVALQSLSGLNWMSMPFTLLLPMLLASTNHVHLKKCMLWTSSELLLVLLLYWASSSLLSAAIARDIYFMLGQVLCIIVTLCFLFFLMKLISLKAYDPPPPFFFFFYTI